MRSFPIPAVMRNLISVHYDPERDIMDLIGRTAENPGGHPFLISEVIRFTSWSTKPVMGTRIVFMVSIGT